MRVVADLHCHSRYALATSKDTDLEHLAVGATAKGINLLGTGDFTHPKWIAELKEKLEPVSDSGLFTYGGIYWMLTGEVATVYKQNAKTRKVHHLVNAPDFEILSQVNEFLAKHGNLSSNGRPVLTGLDSAELLEAVSSVSPKVVVIPAHAWTPWFGVFGSRSGFDSLEECYQDQVGKIFALETGLSSDPPMNWRLSALDNVALVSNSDAHSPNPWRLGREANVFELPRLSYSEVFGAIKEKDPKRFLYTVEVDPAYGKYHFTGHSKCGVSLPPEVAVREKCRCRVCGKPLTVGVSQRVEELADRPEGYVLPGSVPFKRLLPLAELISVAIGVGRPNAKRVLEIQSRLVEAFGNEFRVLLDVSHEAIEPVAGAKVADAVIASREGAIEVTPGYDGIYGVPRLP
jgi:uncharacterized protein (TIGR00375 family)